MRARAIAVPAAMFFAILILTAFTVVSGPPLPAQQPPGAASASPGPALPADIQAKLDKLAIETGRPTDQLVEDVVAGYFEELIEIRAMLDSRYDDLKSGKVKPIDGEEAFARLKAKTEAQRKHMA